MAKILIVDDDKLIRTAVNRILTAGNRYEVLEASSGVEGLSLMWEKQPDLVLLDMMMPLMGGLEVLQRVQRELSLREIPIVMLTSIAEREKVEETIRLGIKDYIVKPFDPRTLLDKISRVLGQTSVEEKQKISVKEDQGEEKDRKVLIVSDKPQLRKLAKSYLQEYYTVLEASNGAKALHLALSARPRAILLDSNIPLMSSEEIFKKLRGTPETKNIKIILMAPTNTKALPDGFDGMVAKPLVKGDLILEVNRALGINCYFEELENVLLLRFFRDLPIKLKDTLEDLESKLNHQLHQFVEEGGNKLLINLEGLEKISDGEAKGLENIIHKLQDRHIECGLVVPEKWEIEQMNIDSFPSEEKALEHFRSAGQEGPSVEGASGE